MTTITTIDLTSLNLKSLQSLAKEFKVKNWWTLKKAALLTELTTSQDNYRRAEESCIKAEGEAKKKSKKNRKPKTETSDNLVTIKELAFEFDIKPAKARRILRKAIGLASSSDKTRWEWEDGSNELVKVKLILHEKAKYPEEKEG